MSYALTILGGIGVFLLGMKLLSDNLRDAAGDALRVMLARFTEGKFSSVATGTIFTALVQSSSATTLASIGFVSAGLLTFSQAVGVIFGANLGTTATSWLVALVGFKININAFALPMVGIGALSNLLLKGRRAHLGAALAGFGLIFVGIDILQVGMADLADGIDLSGISAAGIGGRLILVVIGIVMTVLMQSSSAAIAATLTALHAGAIDLPQAAALVIGQAVGTTITAAMAAIGASLAAKRTAAAHIAFNVITAILALVLLMPLFLMAHGAWTAADHTIADATAIAIFHTFFKVAGVAVLLPMLEPFTRLIYRLVPGTEARYAAGLDRAAASIPAVAIEAAQNANREIFHGILAHIMTGLHKPNELAAHGVDVDAMRTGLVRCKEFLDHVRTDPEQKVDHARHLNVLHALDHIERLHRGLDVPGERFQLLKEHPELARAREVLGEVLATASRVEGDSSVADALKTFSDELASVRRRRRHLLLEAAAFGTYPPTELERLLRTLLWCDRLVFHIWRAGYYLEGGAFDHGVEPEEPG
ncbi:MAG: Na/Pi cotransporter family protein [Bradymonadaceae bacterium]